MLLKDNSSRTPENDTLDPSMFEDLTKNDLENGVKGKYFQDSDYFTNILSRNELFQIQLLCLFLDGCLKFPTETFRLQNSTPVLSLPELVYNPAKLNDVENSDLVKKLQEEKIRESTKELNNASIMRKNDLKRKFENARAKAKVDIEKNRVRTERTKRAEFRIDF